MNEDIKAYLIGRYTKSRERQLAKGIDFQITEEQYLEMFARKKSALTRLTRQYDAYLLGKTDRPMFKVDICLTWKPGFARTGAAMTIETAGLYTSQNSKVNNRLRAGEKKTDEAKAKLKKPKSNEHKKSIGESCKGKPKATWSPERKAARAEKMKGRKRGPYNKTTSGDIRI